MAEVRRQRWLRFSLRTMFVACTVVAVWLGWNVYQVRQRQAMLARLGPEFSIAHRRPTLLNGFVAESFVGRYVKGNFVPGFYDQYNPTAPFHVSTLRRWLGDTPNWLIAYRPGPDLERVQRLFPESIIVVPAGPYFIPSSKSATIVVQP